MRLHRRCSIREANPPPGGSRSEGQGWKLAALLSLAACLTGCLMGAVPSIGRSVTHGRVITADQVRLMNPGRTTREEVIARFGKPWAHYDDLQVMVYYWEVRKGWWFWAVFHSAGGAGEAIEITRLRYLFIQFDDLGRVQRCEIVKARGGKGTRALAHDWIQRYLRRASLDPVEGGTIPLRFGSPRTGTKVERLEAAVRPGGTALREAMGGDFGAPRDVRSRPPTGGRRVGLASTGVALRLTRAMKSASVMVQKSHEN